MKYTADDVRAANRAKETDMEIVVEKMSPKSYLSMMVDGAELGAELYKDYLHGKKILETAELIYTDDRYDITNGVGYDMAADKLIKRGCDSPVVEFMWGYVGTSQMAGVMALKEKE